MSRTYEVRKLGEFDTHIIAMSNLPNKFVSEWQKRDRERQ